MKCLCTGYKGLLTSFEEKWKPVVGFEGMYEVSDKGSVKSLARPAWGKTNRFVKEKILTSKVSRTGYEITHLRKDGKNCHPSVHRLVAEAFIPNVESKPTVNHIDGDKLNNSVSNLEWATHKEQSDHAFESDLIVKHNSKLYSPSFKIKVKEYFDNVGCSIRQLADVFCISQRTAGRIANGAFNKVRTKLSEQDVEAILLKRQSGETLSSIAKTFGCGISQIHRITTDQSRNVKYERN